ncbi:MAG: Na+/H+ antiporter NhaC [Sedimentibacter sp.]|uniref:Na+/H+ antiporter NhaC n=1 Tax=Sedimentibacter sp. TaxID=1960295 RepID=UPI0031593166
MNKEKVARKATFGESLIIIIIAFVILLVSIVVFKADAQIPLFLASVIVTVFAFYLGLKWENIEMAIFDSIKTALLPMVIIMLIGVTVGTWIACGTVPYLIYWGLQLISPTWFLVTACIMCSIMSLSTGSSWTTAGTIGVALMGVGMGLGIPPAMTAGAVVSGSFFGDKLSPLSDSTNFAAAVGGTSLFEHVNSMMWTTIPALLISWVIYAIMGLRFSGAIATPEGVVLMLQGIEQTYNLNVALLIPLIVLLVLIIKKVPAIISIAIAALTGAIVGMTIQGIGFGDMLKYMLSGFVGNTGIPDVDRLLTRGGMTAMLGTISIMFMSLSLAGILDVTGCLEAAFSKLANIVKSVLGLITTCLASSLVLNFLAADPYLPMLMTSKIFGASYDEKGIDRKVLSRTLEDTGTLGCAMVPWGTSGVYMSATLGVAVFSYLPFYLLGIITPVVSMVLAASGIGIFYKDGVKRGVFYKNKQLN